MLNKVILVSVCLTVLTVSSRRYNALATLNASKNALTMKICAMDAKLTSVNASTKKKNRPVPAWKSVMRMVNI